MGVTPVFELGAEVANTIVIQTYFKYFWAEA